MAYKHPQLLIHNQDSGDADANGAVTALAQHTDAIDLAAATPADRRTRYESMINRVNLFATSNMNHIAQKAIDSSCKLIGNVKPNLVKTWEQLNGTRPTNRMIEYPEYVDGNGLRNIDFTLNQVATEHSNETFIMSRSSGTPRSDHFYDSIDNESIITEQDDDEQIIASLGFNMEHGGEAMAEYMSIVEKKEKLCWSVDSCN